MKPEDLLSAMAHIPEEYISEAKPKRRGESRSMKQKAAVLPQNRTANGHRSPSRQHGSGKSGKDSSRMSTGRQPVWQRVTTGIVAAAACTVFIGGGLFIAQQAKQPETAAGGYTNFLGGKGDIHVAVSADYPNHMPELMSDDAADYTQRGLDLMYDDTRVYFQGGKYAADRTGDTVSKAYQTSKSVQETLSHTLWDGEQFYYQNGSSLYQMDMTGDWGAGEDPLEPFYHINSHFLNIDAEDTSFSDMTATVTGVQKLSDNDYMIVLRTEGKNADGLRAEGCCAVLHHPQGYRIEDDNQAIAPETAPGIPGQILPVREGDWIAMHESRGFLRVERDKNTTHSFDMTNPAAEYGTAWAIHGNSIYYMTEIVSDNVNYEASHYAAIDIDTGEFTDMGTAEFRSFIPCGDEILYVTKDGKTLYSADFALDTTNLLYAYDDSVPVEIREIVSDKWNAAPLLSLDAADANYAAMTLDCKEDAGSACALFDRGTGEMRYFTLSDDPAPDVQEQSAERNILGGVGEIHTDGKDLAMMYDDTRVYFLSGSVFGNRGDVELNHLYRSGFDPTALMLRTDGEQFYTFEDGSIYRIDSYGNRDAEPFYTISEEKQKALTNQLGEEWELDEYNITKLDDKNYVVDLYAENPGHQNTGLGYLYKPETGEQTALPECVLGFYLTDGENLYASSKNGDLFTVNLETGAQQKTVLTSHAINIFGGWTLSDGGLYYLSYVLGHDYCTYVRLDLQTHAYTELFDLKDFCMFGSFDGVNYVVDGKGSRAYSYGPEHPDLQNILYDFETAPEAVKESVQAAREKNSRIKYNIRGILSIGTSYVVLYFADDEFALLDRKTGAVRYFSEMFAEQPSEVHTQPLREETEPIPTEPADIDTDYNIFLGQGQVVPAYQNDTSNCGLYRDNDYYYATNDENENWVRWPINDPETTREAIPERHLGNGACLKPYTGRLCTDGERVYTERGDFLRETGTQSFLAETISNVLFGEDGIAKTDSAHLIVRLAHIWHIRDYYFATVQLVNTAEPNTSYLKLWCDADGNIITGTTISMDLFEDNGNIDSYFCDAEHENMYVLVRGSIEQEPSPDAFESDYTAPKWDQPILSACISGGKTIFTTEYNEMYIADEEGNVLEKPIDSAFSGQSPKLTPDGSLMYLRWSDMKIGIMNILYGGYTPRTVDELEPVKNKDVSLVPLGYTQNPNGGYDLIVGQPIPSQEGFFSSNFYILSNYDSDGKIQIRTLA